MATAKMWPARLPASVRNDVHRQAEVKVFDLLSEQLGQEWTVFYSRPWLGLTASGEEKDGECDFLVVHAERGYLAIEVKGGGISYDPETEKWLSRDRHGVRHKIKNPIAQATASQNQLLRKLQQSKYWPSDSYVRTRHGVVFTDTISPPSSLGADAPRDIFCCRDELPRLGEWVISRLSKGSGEPMGAGGVRACEELLASPFTLRVPLAHYLDDDEHAIATLTPQQFHILDAVGLNPRIAAGGGAGTGKTIVALEDAIRSSRRGLKTALLCISDQLSAYLTDRLRGVAPDVTVADFRKFACDIANAAGESCRVTAGIDEAIDAMTRGANREPSLRYDAIIVDEAQDFRSHWWIALEEILTRSEQAILHAYFDTNQSVYGDLKGELAAFRMVPVNLTRNLRNTKTVHQAANRFYRGIPVLADGPDGTEIEWIECQASEIAGRVTASARALIFAEKVQPADIAVLGASAAIVAVVRGAPSLPEGVAVEQVRDFKGLERKVIVLAASAEISDAPELAYVALSRARTHLVVIGPAPVLNWLREEKRS